MPARRAFDWDLLRQLVTDDPGLSDYQLAQALTEDNRKRGMPPASKSTVRTVLDRKREEWGIALRTNKLAEVLPPEGSLDPASNGATQMAYLRDLANAKAGIEPSTQPMAEVRSAALGWAQRLRQGRQVVDLTSAGVPITREATASELNSRGELISLMAWRVPGWRDANSL